MGNFRSNRKNDKKLIDFTRMETDKGEQPENKQNAKPDDKTSQKHEGRPAGEGKSPEGNQQKKDEPKPAEDDNWECPICTDTLTDPVVTPCGHMFCNDCIREWLYRSSVCPVCTKHIDRDSLIRVNAQNGAKEVKVPWYKRMLFDRRDFQSRWYHEGAVSPTALAYTIAILFLIFAFFI